MLNQFSCPNCGASDFTQLPDGTLKCKYCNSILFSDNASSSSDSEVFEDEVINVNMMNAKFVIHNELFISGNMNNIEFTSHLDNAKHVSTLKVLGNMNNLIVVLLDGATCVNDGDMNNIE